VRLVQARGGSLRGHRLHLRPPPRSLTGVRRVIRLYSAARLLPIPQVVRKRGGVKGAGWRKGTEGQTGSEVEEGALSAASGPLSLCRSPRLRGCVCATPFAQQLEIGISPPRKSSPPRARALPGQGREDAMQRRRCLAAAGRRQRENPGAARRLATLPFTLHRLRETEREGGREGGRATTVDSPRIVRTHGRLPYMHFACMHLYGVSPRTRCFLGDRGSKTLVDAAVYRCNSG